MPIFYHQTIFLYYYYIIYINSHDFSIRYNSSIKCRKNRLYKPKTTDETLYSLGISERSKYSGRINRWQNI